MKKLKRIIFWYKRKDRNLNKYWGHRLILILSAILFAGVFVLFISNATDLKPLPAKQWVRDGSIRSRTNSSLQSLEDMRSSDVINDYNKIFGSFRINNQIRKDYFSKESLNLWTKEANESNPYSIHMDDEFYSKYVLKNIYCSTKISTYISKLTNDLVLGGLGYNYYSKPFLYYDYSIAISIEYQSTFEKYLHDNNIICVISLQEHNGYNTILYPITSIHDKNFADNYYFYKVSPILSILNSIVDGLFILALDLLIFYVLSIIYHKVILYIAFGKESKNN